VADSYSAADPAVLRLIALVSRPRSSGARCHRLRSDGRRAHLRNPLAGPGYPLPEHAASPVPEIKRVIRAIRNSQAKALAAEVLALESPRTWPPGSRSVARRLARLAPTSSFRSSSRFPRLTLRPRRPTGDNTWVRGSSARRRRLCQNEEADKWITDAINPDTARPLTHRDRDRDRDPVATGPADSTGGLTS